MKSLEKSEDIDGVLEELKSGLIMHVSEMEEGEKDKVTRAIDFVVKLHAEQKYRPDGPYTHHILRVADRIAGYFRILDSDTIISSLMHDSVEDQANKLAGDANKSKGEERALALAKIEDLFGTTVSEVVEKVSNSLELDELEAQEKNIKYAEHIKEVITNARVFYVKLSDFMDNGLNLDKIDDINFQKRLSKKYLPIYSMFIERLKDADIEIPQNIKDEITQKLITAKSFAEDVISNQ